MKPATLIVVVIFHSVSAQQGDYSLSARSSGMGGAHSAIADPFSTFNNIGGAAIPEKTTLIFAIKNLYSIEGLFAMGAACNQKFREGTFVFSLYRFGDRLFSEHKIGIGYSHKIRFISLGIQVNYLQHSVEASETSGTLVIEAGGIVTILPGLTLGAYMLNPNKATIGRTLTEPVPVIMKTGLAWEPDPGILLSIDLHRGPDDRNQVSMGMEYILNEVFPLRVGGVFDPTRFSAGFGIILKRLTIDYGAELDPRLGMTNQFSVIFKFPGR
ncbi:MAG: hypothetical protein KFF73_02550 [Cyclobacteriaceae bacterium]|nr:hypothetical protein [Cyclobacteriaceae bacterium]